MSEIHRPHTDQGSLIADTSVVKFKHPKSNEVFVHPTLPWNMSDAELDLAIGHALGWTTYPNDPIDRGNTFHKDRERAPFGLIQKVREFNPSTRWSVTMPLVIQHRVPIDHVLRGNVECTPRDVASVLYLHLCATSLDR